MLQELMKAACMRCSTICPSTLHLGGDRFGRLGGPVPVTDDVSRRLLGLPLWVGLGESGIQTVVDAVEACARTAVSSYMY